MKYKLHNLIDNNIDWKFNFPETLYYGWAEYFVKYQKSFVSDKNKLLSTQTNFVLNSNKYRHLVNKVYFSN